jgi:hypothetical protein
MTDRVGLDAEHERAELMLVTEDDTPGNDGVLRIFEAGPDIEASVELRPLRSRFA